MSRRSLFSKTLQWGAIGLSVLTAFNILLVYRTLNLDVESLFEESYTWINKDYPLQMPVGKIPTVEMTFQESSRFQSFAEPNRKANWDTLVKNQFGIGFQHLGPYHYRYISGAYHSLHCIYSIQEDFDKPDHLNHPSHHLIHCLMYFRQIFLCNADMTLEAGDFMTKNLTVQRTADTRKCRDWRTVAEWVDQNTGEWLRLNGIQFDT